MDLGIASRARVALLVWSVVVGSVVAWVASAEAQQRSWTWLDEGELGRYDLFALQSSVPSLYGQLHDGTVVSVQMVEGAPVPGHFRTVGWRPDGTVGIDVFSDCCFYQGADGERIVLASSRGGTSMSLDAQGQRRWRGSFEPLAGLAAAALGADVVVLAGSDRPQGGGPEVGIAVGLDARGNQLWRDAITSEDVGAHEGINWRYVVAAEDDVYCLGGSVRRAIDVYDALIGCVSSAGERLWLEVFSDEEDSTDSVYAMAPIGKGGLAVLGTSRPRILGDASAWVRSYDSAGGLLWQSPIDDAFLVVPELSLFEDRLTVSWAGAGESGVIELDDQGAVAWRFDGSSSQDLSFHPASHSRDLEGNVYSAVPIDVEGRRCVGLRRLDPTGNSLWYRDACLETEHAEPGIVRVLPTGNVGVVIWITPPGDEDAREQGYLIFSPAGELVSESRTPPRRAAGGCPTLPDKRCLRVDAAGNSYVTSWSGGVPGRASVESVDAAGESRWRFAPAMRSALPIPQPSSSVGAWRVALAFGRGEDAERVWTLATEGDLLYQARAQHPRALTLRSDGGLYQMNVSLEHLGLSGELEWEASILSSVLELAPEDALAVGVRNGAALVDADGDILWRTTDEAGTLRTAQDLDVSSVSRVAVALAPTHDSTSLDVLVIESDGEVAWSRSFSSHGVFGSESRRPGSIATSVAFSPAGELAVAGQLVTESGTYGVVAFYSSTGELLWKSLTDREGVINAAEADANGLWVAGTMTDGLDDDGFVERYDLLTGDRLFSDVVDNVPGGDERFYDLEIDAFGNVVVAGDSFDQHGLPRRLLVKYSVAGSGALEVEKRVSADAVPGGLLTYQLSVRNVGPGYQLDNHGPEVTDQLPAGLVIVAASADVGVVSIDHVNRSVTWDGGLPPGGSARIEIRARVALDVAIGTPLVNQAMVSYDSNGDGFNDASALSFDPDAGSESATVLIVVAPIPAQRFWGLVVLVVLIAAAGIALGRQR